MIKTVQISDSFNFSKQESWAVSMPLCQLFPWVSPSHEELLMMMLSVSGGMLPWPRHHCRQSHWMHLPKHRQSGQQILLMYQHDLDVGHCLGLEHEPMNRQNYPLRDCCCHCSVAAKKEGYVESYVLVLVGYLVRQPQRILNFWILASRQNKTLMTMIFVHLFLNIFFWCEPSMGGCEHVEVESESIWGCGAMGQWKVFPNHSENIIICTKHT